MVKNKIVKFKKDENDFLAYVPEHRKTLAVNETGKFILENLLNLDISLEEISKRISKRYNISFEEAISDAKIFLEEFKNQLTKTGTALNERRKLATPMTAEIEVTCSCNLCCKHCLHGENHPLVHMSIEKVKEILEILSKNEVWEISIMGGEPFMHPQIMEILEICKSHSMAVNLVTNSLLITEEKADKLSQIPNLVVLVSLDGMQEGHEKIRGKGTYAKTLEAINRLKKRNIPFSINFTLNALNFGEHLETVKFWSEKGIIVNFNIFKPFNKKHKEITISPNDYFTASVELFDAMQKGFLVGLSNVAIMAELLGSEPQNECRATMSGFVLDKDGKMITCPSLMASRFYNRNELPIIDDKNFIENWKNHPFFKDFRELNLRECPGRAHIFSNNIKGIDPYGVNSFINWQKNKK